MKSRLFLPFLLIPVLILVTSLACDIPGSGTIDEINLPDVSPDQLKELIDTGRQLLPLARQVATLTASQENLGALLESPEMGNVRWTGSVRAQLTVVRLVCNQIHLVDPPEGVAGIYQALVDVCGDCQKTVDIVLDGIDNLDVNAISQATVTGQSCLDGLKSNQAAIDELKEKINLDLDDLPLDKLNLEELNLPGLSEIDLPDLGLEQLGETSPKPPTVNAGSNLRAGPGADFDRAGGLTEGTVVAVIGRNQAGDWLALEVDGLGTVWIAAFLIENPPDLDNLPVIVSE
ncbi:MAG: SH3 domain-containing protein [Chloroflexota bacterium]|nr:SH3 domain-containing protein [Chloroflexota bacterium]